MVREGEDRPVWTGHLYWLGLVRTLDSVRYVVLGIGWVLVVYYESGHCFELLYDSDIVGAGADSSYFGQ